MNIDLYAVMGNPIDHSLSPFMHSIFAQQTEQVLSYEKILAPLNAFSETINTFKLRGGKGLNITLPFKQEAYQLVDKHTAEAQRCGAVNAIKIMPDGTLLGANFDGQGLLRDLTINLNIQLEKRNILILGAGGAARSAILALLPQQPQQLVIANRTFEKAKNLAQQFANLGNITAIDITNLQTDGFDIIINATAASIQDELIDLPMTCITENTCCYDMMYSAKPTLFMQWCKQQGAACVVDGLGMLIEQGADSFEFWRGIRPDTKPLFTLLRDKISGG